MLFARLLRRLGYVRLRDFNLRLTARGDLTPIDGRYGIPIDYGQPALGQRTLQATQQLAPQASQQQPLLAPQELETPSTGDGMMLWPEIDHLGADPLAPRSGFAEGTEDRLNPVLVHSPAPRNRAARDTLRDDKRDDLRDDELGGETTPDLQFNREARDS